MPNSAAEKDRVQDLAVFERTAVAEVDIPDLKKREKERKKAGVAWGSARPVGTPFYGATGGNGAASAVARSAASAAAPTVHTLVETRAAGTLLARLLALLPRSRAGKALFFGALAVIAGGALLFIARFFGGSPSQRERGLSLSVEVQNLGARRPGDSTGLKYAAQANRGALKTDKAPEAGPVPVAGKPPEAGKSEKAPAAPPALDRHGIDLSQLGRTDRLPHNLDGSKLTDRLGAQFSGKNIFGGSSAPKFGDSFDRGRLLSFLRPKAEKGNLRKMNGRQASSARGASATNLRGFSRRAMGQLKLARVLSVAGSKGATDEMQRQLAADAFEQKVTLGGTPPAGPEDVKESPNPQSQGGGTVNPLGPGAQDITDPVPPDATGVNATPYQQPLNDALAMGAQAAQMRRTAMMLFIIGAILIALGIAMMGIPIIGPIIGAILIGIGSMLIGMAIMLTMMAGQLANQARRMADMIKAAYAQQAQAQIIDECMDQAIGNGTPPDQCRPSTGAPDFTSKGTTIPEAVANERNATWELEPGRPLNDTPPQPMGDPAPRAGPIPFAPRSPVPGR